MKLTEHFNINEFACNDREHTPVPEEFIYNCIELSKNLEVLRAELKCPIHINSGYRTKAYNASLQGSATNSQHLQAKAADITTAHHTPSEIRAKIIELINAGKMKQGGVGFYNNFIHYDIRGVKARRDFRSNK